MKRFLFLLCGLMVFVSCKNTPKPAESVATEELEMYNPSEMTMLMKEMYISNEMLKEKIVNNDSLGNFNATFLKIHNAVLTDRFERTRDFEEKAQTFISNQEAIFNVSEEDRGVQFNLMVNSCIACHKTTCTGPIPRIKKLLIN